VGDVNQRLFLTRSLPGTEGPVLEVGSRDYGNTESFRDVYAHNEYVGVDLSAGRNVDRVVDLAAGIADLPERTSPSPSAARCSSTYAARGIWRTT